MQKNAGLKRRGLAAARASTTEEGVMDKENPNQALVATIKDLETPSGSGRQGR